MLLSQELSAWGTTERVGKRFTEVQRPEAGPTGLGAGPTGRVGPVGLEAGLVGVAGLLVEEEGPVGLEAGCVRRQGYSWPIHPISPTTEAGSYPGSVVRTGQPPPSRDGRLLLPSSEEGFLRSHGSPSVHPRQLPPCLHPPTSIESGFW